MCFCWLVAGHMFHFVGRLLSVSFVGRLDCMVVGCLLIGVCLFVACLVIDWCTVCCYLVVC
jgi:hypothetical protein